MRKVNTDRMRRHVARSNPDQIERLFDMLDDNQEQQYYDWLSEFSKRMAVKHGGPVTLDIIAVEDMTHLGQHLIKVKVRKEI